MSGRIRQLEQEFCVPIVEGAGLDPLARAAIERLRDA